MFDPVLRSGGSRWLVCLVVVLLAVVVPAVWSSSARAADCSAGANGSAGDFGYNAACGPKYESPAWGDGDGWDQVSKYSTIQLADITGNGQDELLARNDDGLEIWRFDTSIGQWRPAIGADGRPEILTDFRSPTPSEPPDSHGANPMVYSTIQTADIVGNGTESIVAQFPDGVHTWDYTPPSGTHSIDGGTWHEEPVSGPTNPSPSVYLSMHVLSAHKSVYTLQDFAPDKPSGSLELPATIVYQDAYYVHSAAGGWQETGQTTNAPYSADAKYYLDSRPGLWPEGDSEAGSISLQPSYVYRTADGIGWQSYDYDQCDDNTGICSPGWIGVDPDAFAAPFPDKDSTVYHCQTTDFSCFGDSPSRYETLRIATDLRGPDDPDGYVLGRLDDGLHVYASDGDWRRSIPVSPHHDLWNTLPVLTALKDSPTSDPPASEWSTIRTGDVTGDGHTDVLAVVNGTLDAWELESNGSGGWTWSQLPAQVPLNLGSPWSDSASDYSTIQVGQVAGSGYPDGVIARGPYGVRTWFYCTANSSGSTGSVKQVPGCASLGGQSGWTSWGGQGSASYPQYTGQEAAAWSALTNLAHSKGLIGQQDTSIRSAWTADVPPTDEDLVNLTNGLVFDAGCTGTPVTVNPTTYGTCTPPSGSTGFTAADWKTVVNDTLSEIYDAQQVLDYFALLDNIRADAYLTNDAALPAIGSELQPLNGAAATPVTISPWGAGSAGVGIAGAIASALFAANPEVGLALSIASYGLGIISSGTPALQAPAFFGTYADLQSRYAKAVSQSLAAIADEKTDVLQDWGQSQLVTALTAPSGPWHEVDGHGLIGAMEEGLTLWAYKTLLPTLYDRYAITNCHSQNPLDEGTDCNFTVWKGLVGPNGGSFTTLGTPPAGAWVPGLGSPGTPCYVSSGDETSFECDYTSPPTQNGSEGDLATQIWGPVSNNCNYTGDPDTAWTFGCNLGVDPTRSVGVDGDLYGWDFTTCVGNPIVSAANGSGVTRQGSCTAPSGTADPGDDGALQIAASTGAPSGFRVTSATFTAKGLLAPTQQASKTDAKRAQTKATTIHLSLSHGKQLAGGGSELGTAKGAPPATLALTRQHGKPQLQFSVSRIGVVTPQACQQLPASVSETTPSFRVQTSLRLSNGHRTQTISMPATWRCMRNRAGSITKIITVKPTAPAHRPGLRVSVRAPRRVYPGTTINYRVHLHNTRNGHGGRTASSLWNLAATVNVTPARGTRRAAKDRVTHSVRPVVRRLRELRHGHTRTLRIAVHIPSALRHTQAHRVCISTLATADAARSASARTCPIVSSGPPPGRD